MSILKEIMAAYSEAKDDASFDKGHPIFQMAKEIDDLRAELARKDEEIEAWKGMYIDAENKEDDQPRAIY